MDLRPLLSVVLSFSVTTPALADLDHCRARIVGYEMVSHLLVYNNPNLIASLTDHGAHRSAYSERLNELERLSMRAGNPELRSAFSVLKGRISALETSGSADRDRLATWINPILDAHTKLDSTVAIEERKAADGSSPVSDIMLRLARINFYYQLRTFSTLSVPLLRDASDPIATLDTAIIEDFSEAQQQFPTCSKQLARSLRDYRFIRPGLLDNRSAWIHDSVHRYTSSISARLTPLLKDGACTSAEAATAR
ncbi:hypothetical protein [Stutzerimonas stutzeri]|uniref:hypothetical protein n=1 Tax=Stutzerimonas stutzeri TaxID=316 RepID=UPI0021089F5A|nr:hypothetical protein [Stutzerimonas stutzeri]MCQ4260591.1 hypothetical protein [Stutzerimonas stutzeri]